MKPELKHRYPDLRLSPKHIGLLVGVCGLLVLLELLGDTARLTLRYDRAALAAGEWWRAFTAHLVHLGWRHLALNLAGLVLMALLFIRDYTPWRWLSVILASMAAIDLGLYAFEPQLEWYVGFSGVLHGIMAAGTWARWQVDKKEAAFLTVFLIAKLAWEHWSGALPSSEAATGGAVIVQAHFYGAVGGSLAALVLRRRGLKLQ